METGPYPCLARDPGDLSARLSAVLREPMLGARTAGSAPVVAFMSNQVCVELSDAARCFPLQLPTGPLAEPVRRSLVLHAHLRPARGRRARATDRRRRRRPRPAGAARLVRRDAAAVSRAAGLRCDAKYLPEVFLHDVVQTSLSPSSKHNQERMLALRQRLEARSGQRSDDAALSASINVFDGVRTRPEARCARRRQVPCRLEGAVAMDVFSACQRMWPDGLCEALDDILAIPGERVPGTRTFLIGSAHDTPAVHRLIARAGGQVVGDNHWRGELLLMPPIALRLPPLRALTSHYHGGPVSSHTFRSSNVAPIDCARRAHAEVAVFFYYAQSDVPAWDYPVQSEALSAAGIPSLPLELQAYPPSVEVGATLRGFDDSVRRL